MAIWLTENSKVIVQGIPGWEGSKHASRMVAAGTKVVGGVNAKKAGTEVDGLPVFGTVTEAMEKTGADVSVVFVPPKFVKDAVLEAVEAEIPLIVVITEGIPVHDSTEFYARAVQKGKSRLMGPNCPGFASPAKTNAGTLPADITPA